jgi:hypothetical protein
VTKTAIILGSLAVGAATAVQIGARRQRRSLARMVAELERHSGDGAPDLSQDTGALPPLVGRYLARVLPRGPRAIRVARFEQRGEIRTDADSPRWLPFEATHIVTPSAPGFVWNARVRLAPLVHVRVRDALVQGAGSGHVALMSALTLSAARGNAAMNAGSLHRFLAEAVWYPTALLPSARLRWTGVDDASALATLTDHGTSVSLEFRFNSAGECTSIYTPARWGTFRGGYQERPWEGHFRHYEPHGDFIVPAEGDVGWYLKGGWQPVWRGRVTAAEYDLAGAR